MGTAVVKGIRDDGGPAPVSNATHAAVARLAARPAASCVKPSKAKYSNGGLHRISLLTSPISPIPDRKFPVLCVGNFGRDRRSKGIFR